MCVGVTSDQYKLQLWTSSAQKNDRIQDQLRQEEPWVMQCLVTFSVQRGAKFNVRLFCSDSGNPANYILSVLCCSSRVSTWGQSPLGLNGKISASNSSLVPRSFWSSISQCQSLIHKSECGSSLQGISASRSKDIRNWAVCLTLSIIPELQICKFCVFFKYSQKCELMWQQRNN